MNAAKMRPDGPAGDERKHGADKSGGAPVFPLPEKQRGADTSSAIPAVRARYAQPASAPAASAMVTPGRPTARNTASSQHMKKTSENIVHPNSKMKGLIASRAISTPAIGSENQRR